MIALDPRNAEARKQLEAIAEPLRALRKAERERYAGMFDRGRGLSGGAPPPQPQPGSVEAMMEDADPVVLERRDGGVDASTSAAP